MVEEDEFDDVSPDVRMDELDRHEVPRPSDVEDEIMSDIRIEPPRPPPVWPRLATEQQTRADRQLQRVRDVYEGTEVSDPYQIEMVSEYAEEIFDYMRELEVCSLAVSPTDIS